MPSADLACRSSLGRTPCRRTTTRLLLRRHASGRSRRRRLLRPHCHSGPRRPNRLVRSVGVRRPRLTPHVRELRAPPLVRPEVTRRLWAGLLSSRPAASRSGPSRSSGRAGRRVVRSASLPPRARFDGPVARLPTVRQPHACRAGAGTTHGCSVAGAVPRQAVRRARCRAGLLSQWSWPVPWAGPARRPLRGRSLRTVTTSTTACSWRGRGGRPRSECPTRSAQGLRRGVSRAPHRERLLPQPVQRSRRARNPSTASRGAGRRRQAVPSRCFGARVHRFEAGATVPHGMAGATQRVRECSRGRRRRSAGAEEAGPARDRGARGGADALALRQDGGRHVVSAGGRPGSRGRADRDNPQRTRRAARRRARARRHGLAWRRALVRPCGGSSAGRALGVAGPPAQPPSGSALLARVGRGAGATRPDARADAGCA